VQSILNIQISKDSGAKKKTLIDLTSVWKFSGYKQGYYIKLVTFDGGMDPDKLKPVSPTFS
jgi:hypothetical protein